MTRYLILGVTIATFLIGLNCQPVQADDVVSLGERHVRAGLIRMSIAIRRGLAPSLTDKQLADQVDFALREVSIAAFNCYWPYLALKEDKSKLFEHNEFDAEKFFKDSEARLAAIETFEQGLWKLAALPSDEVREFAQLALESVTFYGDQQRLLECQLKTLLVGGKLPAGAIEQAQAFFIESDQRIHAEGNRLEAAIARAREKVAQRFPPAENSP